jgi:adenylate kinase family enzyme
MIIITGAAATGKSTVTRLMREQLPKDKFDIHDIDESDKWTNSYEEWRDAKIDYWLRRSISSNEAGITTALCGIIYPKNVTDADYYTDALPMKYFLLDAMPNTITTRFKLKLEAQEKSGLKGRNQIDDKEAWLKRQIEISRELRQEYGQMANATIIETTDLGIEDVLAKVMLGL